MIHLYSGKVDYVKGVGMFVIHSYSGKVGYAKGGGDVVIHL